MRKALNDTSPGSGAFQQGLSLTDHAIIPRQTWDCLQIDGLFAGGLELPLNRDGV